MNRFVNSLVITLCLTLFISVQLSAQEWSDKQKEVWKNLEARDDLANKGDVEGFLSYFHSDFSGWSINDALPRNKEQVRKRVTHRFPTGTTLLSDMQPVAIKIHGNVAIVHFYYSGLRKDVEGKERNISGRWTEILMKQGDKWVLIGNSGGRTSTN